MCVVGKKSSLTKEHLTFLTSSQCFVRSGSWLNTFLLLKNVTCIRDRWSTYYLWSVEGGITQCFHCVCFDPVEPRKIHSLRFHWFLHSTVYLGIYTKDLCECTTKVPVSYPNWPCRWVSWAWHPPFLSRKIESVNKYICYKYKVINISTKFKNLT